jgi:LacI family transcriptional regulator
MSKMMKRFSNASTTVTIREVARGAGVSIATASYALNETGRVSTETREKVLQAAESLCYAPSIAAQLLKGARGNLIAVLAEGLAGPWYGEILEGLQPTANAKGFAVVAMTIQTDTLMLCRSLVSAGLLRGLIILNPKKTWASFLAPMVKFVPTVLFDSGFLDVKAIKYILDNRGAVSALMNHLWDRGYRDYLWLDGDLEAAWDARERYEAFDAFLNEKGLPQDRRRRAVGGFKADVAERSVSAVLGQDLVPRAVVAANDESAMGALKAIRRFGLRVPEDIAVAGFDGLDICEWLNPALTTLRYDRRALGQRMALSVMDAVAEGAMDETTIVPLSLLVRGST